MKVCSECKQEKDESCYSFKNKQKGTLQNRCKQCYNEYNRRYYKNGEQTKQIKRVNRNKQRDRIKYQEWKSTQRCLCCGEDSVECLDLHHTDPSIKDGVISDMIGRSWQRVMEEISKCVVLCANCHRKVHSGRLVLPL